MLVGGDFQEVGEAGEKVSRFAALRRSRFATMLSGSVGRVVR